MEVFGHTKLKASMKDVFAESIYPLDSRILLVPFSSQEEHNRWLKFLDLTMFIRFDPFFGWYQPCMFAREYSIELDNPFVPVVSDFAVAAFNELCRMYVKKGVKDNIYEAEVTNVKYVTNIYGYKFIITLEALEEDVVGVYEATVLCHCNDGRRTLLNFIRLPCSPVGRKFKGMTELVREKSMYEAVKEQKKAIKTELKIKCNAMKDRKKAIKSELKIRRKAMKGFMLSVGMRRSRESSEIIRLKKHYKIVKGACCTFARYTHIMPMDWKIKRSNPDDWFIPNKNTGLQPRSRNGGYDYYNPLTVFSCYTKKLQNEG